MTDTPKNTLSKCFEKLLSLYGINKSYTALENEISYQQDEDISPDVVSAWGESIGIHLNLQITELESLKEPAVIFLENDEVCVCTPDEEGFKLFIPDKGTKKVTFKTLEKKFLGYAIFFGGIVQISDKKSSQSWFWAPLKSGWRNYSNLILCTVLINLFVIALPLYTMNIYDKVVPNFARETLIALTVGILIVLVFDFIVKTIRIYIAERVSSSVSEDFDIALMQKIFAVPQSSMNLSVGEKSGLFRELQNIRDFFVSKIVMACVDVPFFTLFIFVIYTLSPALAVIPLSAAAAIIILNLFVYHPLNKRVKKHIEDGQSKTSILVEMLSGVNSIKFSDAITPYIYRWKSVSKNASHSSQSSQFLSDTIQALSLLFMYLANVGVVFFGVFEIEQGTLTVGGLIACTILSGRAVAPVLGVAGLLGRVQHTKDILKLIDKIFALPQEVETEKSYERKKSFKGKIELKDVSFQYPNQLQPALRQINMVIKPKEKIGLIGQTGAGKTTLSKVIAGEVHPLQGTISVDNCNLQEIHPYDWRRNIGIVPQNPHFFSGSVRDNITMGRNYISDEAFEKAIKISGVDIFMEATGQGYEAKIGEGGEFLSGGQKQAIALARAIVHEPQLLIFDEPTNGMDHALEVRIIQAFREYLKDKTFIMITHRTTLLPLVDRLVLINKGQIAADGPCDEIIKKLGAS